MTLVSDGTQRTYLMHLPSGEAAGRRYPLVVAFHGRGETPGQLESYSDLDRLPAVIVYPAGASGSGGKLTWQGNPFSAPGVDDVSFTSEIISAVERSTCVDQTRIDATGKSDGAGFLPLLACQLSDRITAIAPVAGAFYQQPHPCRPAHPVSVLNFHGTADPVIPYNGDPGRHLLSVAAFLQDWTSVNECAGTPKTVLEEADILGTQWSDCAQGSTVVNYQITGGGHTWPGATQTSGPGTTTHTIDATTLIGQFFKIQ